MKFDDRFEVTDAGRAAMREYSQAHELAADKPNRRRFPLLHAIRKAEREGLLTNTGVRILKRSSGE